MKKSLYVFFTFLLCSTIALAQGESRTIIDDLNATKYGQGTVVIMQDESINSLIAIRQSGALVTPRTNTSGSNPDLSSDKIVKVRGYKVQVFSGNDQKKSKNDAEYRRSQVRTHYPDLETVITYNSPFWRLRVGNFVTKEEAEDTLKEMKSTFPAFKEMHVVSDVIKRIAP